MWYNKCSIVEYVNKMYVAIAPLLIADTTNAFKEFSILLELWT